MKKYVLASCFAAVALLISSVTIAQNTTKSSKPAAQTKEKPRKEKLDEYDEIIIKRKGDKDGKVTIEIKDGEVKVNGKTLDDYDDENISVRRRPTPRIVIAGSPSRFRSADAFGHGGSWNYSDDGDSEIFFSSGNKAFLGVSSEEEDGGAKITSVTENSAADKAGLKKGDVITKVGDNDVDDPSDLTKAIGKFKPEDKVTIVYKRDGKEAKTTATLGKNKSSSVSTYGYASPRVEIAPMPPMQGFEWNEKGGQHYFGNFRPRLGIKAQDTEEGKGVKVLDVADESLAEKAGIKEGDIIIEFDGKTINSADDLAEAAQDAKEKTSMKVQLTRDGKSQTVEIKIPKKLKTANL